MPKYLLLNVTPNGFQIGGGTESEARFKTNTYQLSDDFTLIRGPTSSSSAATGRIGLRSLRRMCGLPGQLTVGNTVTGLALEISDRQIVGHHRVAAVGAELPRDEADYVAFFRPGHVARLAARDDQLRLAMGAVFPAAESHTTRSTTSTSRASNKM